MKLAKKILGSFPFALFCLAAFSQQTVSFADKRWTVTAQGRLLENYKGYPAMYLQNGMAYLADERFGNGIIEFDVFLTQRTSFSGMVFRLQDAANYEELYLRSQLSGYPDAYQYTPVFNDDPAWQLYHDQHDAVNDGFIHFQSRGKAMGYNGVLNFAFDRWMHVKLLVYGEQAELYLDNSNKPSAFISKLGRGLQSGGLGVKCTAGASWFANFSFTKTNKPGIATKEIVRTAALPGTVHLWSVSGAFKEDVLKNRFLLETGFINSLKWTKAATDETGLLNLSVLSSVTDSTNTVWAKLVLTSEKDQVKKLHLGYSDRIVAFCNGQILYSGNTGFRTRDYKYLGTIGYFDAVYLPLKKGQNTVLLAVSETFGGWGLQARFDDTEGLLFSN